MMFRNRGRDRILTPAAQSAVYQAGKQEWMEQNGDLVSARNSWRLAALGSIAVSLLAVGGIVYLGNQIHAVPYIVKENVLGQVIGVAPVQQAPVPEDGMIRFQLQQWITEARTVSTDPIAEKRFIGDVYAMVDKGSEANGYLNDYYSVHSPFMRASSKTVSIENVLVSTRPISPHMWQVTWCEDARGAKGDEISTTAWTANVSVTFSAPKTEAAIAANPTGLFVNSIAWQQLPTNGNC